MSWTMSSESDDYILRSEPLDYHLSLPKPHLSFRLVPIAQSVYFKAHYRALNNLTSNSTMRGFLAGRHHPKMSVERPQRKTIAELKRPDLKGKFKCITCGNYFQHSASLNRHRATQHSVENTCLICNELIAVGQTVRDHMAMHGLDRIFTCGCCNWSFESKKIMVDHVVSIRTTGDPGEGKPLAINSHAPGSLLQSVVHGGTFSPKPKKSTTTRRIIRSSISPSSSRSSSPPSGNTNIIESDVKDQVTNTLEAPDYSDIFSQLSALGNNAPFIENFEDAITFIFSNTTFTDEQITDPFVWQHIVQTAAMLTGQ